MNNNQTNVEVINENLVKAAIQKAGGVSAVARLITKKYFSFGDKNEATTGLKMLGTIVCVMGGVLVMFIK
jgi:hypothetical protein